MELITDRGLAFFISLLVLETGMVGVFVSMDLFLFYVFWEIQLIPMYFIIGFWGGARRVYAAIVSLHLVGSGADAGGHSGRGLVVPEERWSSHFRYLDLQQAGPADRWPCGRSSPSSSPSPSRCRCSRCTPGFRTPIPRLLRPVQSYWLGCLKMGVYGMIRFCIGFFPEVAVKAMVPVLILSAVAVVYGAVDGRWCNLI